MARKKMSEQEKSEARKARELVLAAAPVPVAPAGFQKVYTGPRLKRVGEQLQGTYIGVGPERKIGKKVVGTYLIKEDGSGTEVELRASNQLDQFFATVQKGWGIWIARSGQAETSSGRRVNTFEFAIRRGKE